MADKIDQVIKKFEKLEDDIAALRIELNATADKQATAIQELSEKLNHKLKLMENEMIGTIKRTG